MGNLEGNENISKGVSWETTSYIEGHKAELQAGIASIERLSSRTEFTHDQIAGAIDHILRASLFDGKAADPLTKGAIELVNISGQSIGEKNILLGQAFSRLSEGLNDTPYGAILQIGRDRGIDSSDIPEHEALYKALGQKAIERNQKVEWGLQTDLLNENVNTVLLEDGTRFALAEWLLNLENIVGDEGFEPPTSSV